LTGRPVGRTDTSVSAKAPPPKTNPARTTSPQTTPPKPTTPQTTPEKVTTPAVAEPGKPLINSIGMKLAYIAPGKFLMGTSAGDIEIARKGLAFPAGDWDKAEGPQHQVTISKPFYMGVYAVTQGQYEKVMGNNPAANKESPDHPVEMVNWNDAIEFCRKLSEVPEEKKAGRIYRLPTEAEWEYACRAGTTTLFHFGNSLSSQKANFNGEQPFGPVPKGPRRGKTVPVGSFDPNPWGLYDMHGNVYQWCLDGQRNYTPDAVTDPHGPEAVVPRMLRGGDWSGPAWVCRAACRVKTREPAKYRTDRSGFRVVCEW
jgi:formylglycine-generating enzyme required for sulfatase activity